MAQTTMRCFSLVFCLVLLCCSLAGCGKTTQSPELWGRGEAKEIDITSKIPGRVVTLLVKEGDRVQPGQLLASRIDSRDINAQVNQALAGIQAFGGAAYLRPPPSLACRTKRCKAMCKVLRRC